jgi:hypothetical protein
MAALDGGGFRTVDDMLVQLKGLVLVRDLRERRGGPDQGELRMYGTEIDRVRGELASLVGSGR